MMEAGRHGIRSIVVMRHDERHLFRIPALQRRLRAANLEVVSADLQSPPIEADMYLEGGAVERPDQLMTLRCISAMAPDHAIIATTSPILSMNEVAASVTNPARIFGFAPVFPFWRNMVEIVRHPDSDREKMDRLTALAHSIGLRAMHETMGGPTAMTRVFGQIAIEAWNQMARETSPTSPAAAEKERGWPLDPLRILDAMGLADVSALLGRQDELDELRPADRFGPRTPGSTLGADVVRQAVRSAVASILADGIVSSKDELASILEAGISLDPCRFRDWTADIEIPTE